MNQGWPNAATRAACGLQRVASLQLCVAYIAVTHYKIRLIKKWPSRTELLAITDECVGVALCLSTWLAWSKTNYLYMLFGAIYPCNYDVRN